MPYFRQLVSALLVAAGCSSASAAVSWVCGLSGDSLHLVCVADPEAAEVEPSIAKTALVVMGTAFPLNPRNVYTVPLWSPPTDAAFLEELARATICFRSDACEVIVVAPSLGRQAPERLRPQLTARR
jgi:hypothetical protein